MALGPQPLAREIQKGFANQPAHGADGAFFLNTDTLSKLVFPQTPLARSVGTQDEACQIRRSQWFGVRNLRLRDAETHLCLAQVRRHLSPLVREPVREAAPDVGEAEVLGREGAALARGAHPGRALRHQCLGIPRWGHDEAARLLVPPGRFVAAGQPRPDGQQLAEQQRVLVVLEVLLDPNTHRLPRLRRDGFVLRRQCAALDERRLARGLGRAQPEELGQHREAGTGPQGAAQLLHA
mmetsp:Transcript_132332/g.423401  ORF Transcript_132332/g.423401 Transcript_132332/m.423401 type:complete len:238 (+) Transcript_132332:1750-2463(+)